MRFGVVAHDTIVPTTVRFEDEAVDVGSEYYGYVAGGLIFAIRAPSTMMLMAFGSAPAMSGPIPDWSLKHCQPTFVSRANSSRYGPATRRSIRARTQSGETWRTKLFDLSERSPW